MAAETNTIMQSDLARARVIDFNEQFTGSLTKLMELLGTTRKIAVQEGATLKMLRVTGTLESGTVAEGELIPLSKYATVETSVGEVELGKWRKATTAEAILKGGYDQAVGATTDKMVKDIQKTIRTKFFAFLATGVRCEQLVHCVRVVFSGLVFTDTFIFQTGKGRKNVHGGIDAPLIKFSR